MAKEKREWHGRFLRDPKLEALALYYFRTGDLEAAYRQAGYTSEKNWRRIANRLIAKPEVERRLAQLHKARETQVMDSVVDVQNEVMESLRETRDLSRLEKKFSDKNKADELIGKSIGLFKEVVREEDALTGKSPNEIEQVIDAMLDDPIIGTMIRKLIARKDAIPVEGKSPSVTEVSAETKH